MKVKKFCENFEVKPGKITKRIKPKKFKLEGFLVNNPNIVFSTFDFILIIKSK